MAMGTLVSDPMRRASGNGRPYVTATINVAAEGAEASLVSLIAFAPLARESLAVHREGDTVCAGGRASLKQWINRDGETRHGISIVVEQIVSEHELATRRMSAAPATIVAPRSEPEEASDA